MKYCYKKIIATIVCTLLLTVSLLEICEVEAEGEATILIDPPIIQVSPGDNFTMTINATNVASIGSWQIWLKFNASVMNVTSMWIPRDNIFGDPAVIPQQSVEPSYGVDFADGMGYAGFGNSLFSGEVSVSNGILCIANCTALDEGATTIQIATKSNPVTKTFFATGLYSFLATWSDQYQEYRDIPQPLSVKSAVLTCGSVLSKPIATFVAVPTVPDRRKYLVLDGHSPGDIGYAQAYKDYSVTFNASNSIGVVKLENGTIQLTNAGISAYHWDFGDDTYAVTDSPIISHTYNVTGKFTVTLWIEDRETPPVASDTTILVVVVGLALDYFNWMPFIYTLFALIAVATAFYVLKETRRYLRTRRELKTRRLTGKTLSNPT